MYGTHSTFPSQKLDFLIRTLCFGNTQCDKVVNWSDESRLRSSKGMKRAVSWLSISEAPEVVLVRSAEYRWEGILRASWVEHLARCTKSNVQRVNQENLDMVVGLDQGPLSSATVWVSIHGNMLGVSTASLNGQDPYGFDYIFSASLNESIFLKPRIPRRTKMVYNRRRTVAYVFKFSQWLECT